MPVRDRVAKASNALAATPTWLHMPAPGIDILAIAESTAGSARVAVPVEAMRNGRSRLPTHHTMQAGRAI